MDTRTTIANRVADMEPEDIESNLVRIMERQATDPSTAFFPPLMPIELAMRVDTPQRICQAYDISREDFAALIHHPVFVKAYQEAVEMLKVDGMSFKTKAKMQSEDYLATVHAMVKNPNVNDSVRADLIKATVRWAGLDQKAVETGNGGNTFAIQINLG